VTVKGINDPPTADAGEDRIVGNGTSVILDGSPSSDPEGDSLNYSWAQSGGPDVTLADADTSTPTFTTPDIDTETDITFELTVDDGSATDTDTVVITVQRFTGPPPVTGEGLPTDPDSDGLYEDVRGSGSFNILDVQALFNNLEKPPVTENARYFYFNPRPNPQSPSVLDVQALFNEL
jgi:hypothetical protein